MNFIVLTAMSQPNKLSSIYFDQLRKAGIPYHVDQISMNSPSDGTMSRCVTAWRDLSRRFYSYDRLIITDAWDVLCCASTGRRCNPFPFRVLA